MVWTARVHPRFSFRSELHLSRIAYVNGRYLSRRDASVNIEDRGYQFADGVYELCEVREGRLIDERRHVERLRRSLAELKTAWPLARRPSRCWCAKPSDVTAYATALSTCK